MKLIIDIDDKRIEGIKLLAKEQDIATPYPTLEQIIANGIQFSIDNLRSEIEEKYEKYKYLFDTDFMGTKDLEWVLSVIDKYSNEVSE